MNTFLKSKYGTIDDLNTAYGTDYADWGDLLEITSVPDDSEYPARYEDKLDFQEEIADRYYAPFAYYARLYDPNHLLFSTRWAMWADSFTVPYKNPFNERIWKKAGQYCDVFANNGHVGLDHAENVYGHFRRVFEHSKRPWILTEHSVWASDTIHPYRHWPSPTQMQRSESYVSQLKWLFDNGVDDDPNDPGNPAKTCMGFHWFVMYDQPALGRPDGENLNDGVCDTHDEAYLPLKEMMTAVHGQMYDYLVHQQPIEVPDRPVPVAPTGAGRQVSETASSFELNYSAPQLLPHRQIRLVDDPDAARHKAWLAAVADLSGAAVVVYGPKTPAGTMWPGAQCTVTFRLKVADNTSPYTVCTISATTLHGSVVHAGRSLMGADFSASGAYQEFSLSFVTPNPDQPDWEMRVHSARRTDLYIDTIRVSLAPASAYRPGPISDGQDITVWSSASHAASYATEWFAVYLGPNAVEVDRLRVKAGTIGPAGMPRDFHLQYSSDSVNWTTIPMQSHIGYSRSGGVHDFSFAPVTCRYLRILATRLNRDDDGMHRVVIAGVDVISAARTGTPTFEWTPAANASSFTLLLSPEINFPDGQTIRVEGITDTNYTPTVPLAQGTWHWTVKSVDPAGREGSYAPTVKCEIVDLPAAEFDHLLALRCERLPDWRNTGNADTSGDGCAFAMLDNYTKSEGESSLRLAITTNSYNKTMPQINQGTQDIAFRYAGKPLDYSEVDVFEFDIYPTRFCDTTETIVPSSKYVRVRVTDLVGGVVVDQAVDPAGALPTGQWSRIALPMSGRRSQVTCVEFYVKAGADKLTWDTRVAFNIDNITTAPVADVTPPAAPEVSAPAYITSGSISAFIEADDPESGITEYSYAVGTYPGLGNILSWRSNGTSPQVEVSDLNVTEGTRFYVSASATNGYGMTSTFGSSAPVVRVRRAASPNDARMQPEGAWVALEDVIVAAAFDDRFYVAQPDRSSGIGVIGSDSVSVGDRVAVYGKTCVVDREAVILGSASGALSGAPPTPFAMNNNTSGGSGAGIQDSVVDDARLELSARGLCGVGCLVRLSGRARYVEPSGSFFYLDDGSGIYDGSGHTGIRVDTHRLPAPVEGSFACVSGIMSVTDIGGRCARLLRPRSTTDIWYEQTANYLVNPGFEYGTPSPWVNTGNPGEVRAGSYYFGITPFEGSFMFGVYGNWTLRSGTLYQTAQVTPGRSYSASVHSRVYHGGNDSDSAMNRIGIDPTGGIDPSSPDVAWSDWDFQEAWYYSEWRRIETPPVTAFSSNVTVFLDYLQQNPPYYHVNCFDKASLVRSP